MDACENCVYYRKCAIAEMGAKGGSTCKKCTHHPECGVCACRSKNVAGFMAACELFSDRNNPTPHSWYPRGSKAPKEYKISGIDIAKPSDPVTSDAGSYTETLTREIMVQIREDQERVIQYAVRQIGGSTFEDITIDRGKIVEALTLYRDREQYERVVRCKDCGLRYTVGCSARCDTADMGFCSNGIIKEDVQE